MAATKMHLAPTITTTTTTPPLFANTVVIEIFREAITWQSLCSEESHLKRSWHTQAPRALIRPQVLLKARRARLGGKLGLKGNYTPTALVCAPSTLPTGCAESKEIRGASSAHEMAHLQRAARNDGTASLCDATGPVGKDGRRLAAAGSPTHFHGRRYRMWSDSRRVYMLTYRDAFLRRSCHSCV